MPTGSSLRQIGKYNRPARFRYVDYDFSRVLTINYNMLIIRSTTLSTDQLIQVY